MFTTNEKGMDSLDKAIGLIKQHNLDYHLAQEKLWQIYRDIPGATARSAMKLAKAELERLEGTTEAFPSERW